MTKYQKNDDSVTKNRLKARLHENFDASFLYDKIFWILTLGCLKRQFKPNFGFFYLISKCPIFLDAKNILKASKSHFLMVL